MTSSPNTRDTAVVSFRTSKAICETLDKLAEDGMTTRSVIAATLVEKGLGDGTIKGLAPETRAGRRVLVDIKKKLLRALREELKTIEDEKDGDSR